MRRGPRVVSLIASSTEIVCALGLEDFLVGRSHECDFPASVRRLPVLTRSTVDPSAPSGAIDRCVRERSERALSLYEVDREALGRLQPDVVLTQVQCEVCAVSVRDVEGALEGWLGRRPKVVPLGGSDLEGVWADVRRVSRALGRPGKGDALVGRLERRIDAVARRAGDRRPRPTVACLEWLDPLMASGNWVPELVRLAGGRALFGRAGRRSPGLDWGALLHADPEVIAAFPCGFDLERTLRELALLESRPDWGNLRAVQGGRVCAADGNAFFNRPGPRLVESLEILAEMIHPDALDFGHRGTRWRVLRGGGRRAIIH